MPRGSLMHWERVSIAAGGWPTRQSRASSGAANASLSGWWMTVASPSDGRIARDSSSGVGFRLKQPALEISEDPIGQYVGAVGHRPLEVRIQRLMEVFAPALEVLVA